MSEPQKFAWPLSQERIKLLATELYILQDTINRLVPGCARGQQVFRLVNDLRGHVIAAGAEDPFPCFALDLVFPDTPIPTWPDPKLLRVVDAEAQA